MNNHLVLHHLPKWHQNTAYIISLGISPLINLLITGMIWKRAGSPHGEWTRWSFNGYDLEGLFVFLFSSFLVLLSINLVRTLLYRHQRIRRTMLVLGTLVTADLILNVV
jgi:hypothetical protein